MTRVIGLILLTLVATVSLSIGIMHVENLGAANASTPHMLIDVGVVAPMASAADLPDDPTTLLQLIMTGKYMPAVGVGLIIATGLLRTLLSMQWAWFGTKLGGYALGFGSSFALYIGAAFKSGSGVSVGVLLAALGAAWAASGGWEKFRDILAGLKSKKMAVSASAASIVAIIGLTIAGCSSGCGSVGKHPVVSAIVDCGKEDQAKLEALALQLSPLVFGGKPNWSAVYDQAVSAGATIGGCVLADLVQTYLGGRMAVPADESWSARNALEKFRADVAGGATFRTAKGDL